MFNDGNNKKEVVEKERTFLCTSKKCFVFFVRLINFNDFGTGKKLHHKSGSDNGRDSKFHQSSYTIKKN